VRRCRLAKKGNKGVVNKKTGTIFCKGDLEKCTRERKTWTWVKGGNQKKVFHDREQRKWGDHQCQEKGENEANNIKEAKITNQEERGPLYAGAVRKNNTKKRPHLFD